MPTFNIPLFDGYSHTGGHIFLKMLPVEGQAVTLPEAPDVKLFVHKYIHAATLKPMPRAYVVSEYTTGAMLLNDPQATPEKAIEALRAHVAAFPACIESFPLGIKNYLDRYPPANVVPGTMPDSKIGANSSAN